jgi:hypothetical protein
MNKNRLNTNTSTDEQVITSDSFTYHEYRLIREGLLFMETRPRPSDLRNLIIKLDRLFLHVGQCEQQP